ncbi:MAG: methylmalonyl Co-A mutase-associated GTPase MeaB [Gemmatimonadetes bacterium]|nr:methylmalonyl Co-A mutase-associated GTPase MeaB [Gemmatimonadota bacterium]
MNEAAISEAQRELLAEFRAGRRTALARVISLVENGRPGFQELLDALHGDQRRAHRIGITGPPGAGKSTLAAGLIGAYRARGETVAVIAVDPTSPFSGGALLGDRIRMGEVALDPGVYIRSMASRGSLGGLAVTTREAADVVDAFGFDRILVETVGVGQAELDIAAAADTTAVVLVPESGDSIQAMKAGLMEASDLFIVNKADRPGAERMAREIELMLRLRVGQALRNVPAHHGVDSDSRRRAPARWEIPVLQTVAETGHGVPRLVEVLDEHREWLAGSGELARRRQVRLTERVRAAVDRRLQQLAWDEKEGRRLLEEALPALEAGAESPYEVAVRIVRAALG